MKFAYELGYNIGHALVKRANPLFGPAMVGSLGRMLPKPVPVTPKSTPTTTQPVSAPRHFPDITGDSIYSLKQKPGMSLLPDNSKGLLMGDLSPGYAINPIKQLPAAASFPVRYNPR
jgi:hypothetical protein